MKVKMKETFQEVGTTAVLASEGITVSILGAGEIYEVNGALGAFLIENGKAEAVSTETPHYGAQEKPEFRHDEVIYSEITGNVEVVEEEPAEDAPAEEKTPKPRRRSKK